MTINSGNLDTKLREQTFSKFYKRKHRRLETNKGKSVGLVLDKQQIYRPCQARIIDDSFDGCGLLVTTNKKVYKGQNLLILMENIEPMKAQIMWSKRLNKTQFRIGVKYLGSQTLKMKLFFQKTNSAL